MGEVSYRDIRTVISKSESWARVTYYRAKKMIVERWEAQAMMKCEIIRDLIPLYLDKVCSEDSRKLVEEHLAECSECRKYMKELETELEAVKQKKRRRPG